MKKYIIIVFLVLSTFGCETQYKLKINKDLSVNEEMIGLEDEEFYAKYNNKSKTWVVDALIWNARSILNNNNYQYTYEEQGNLYGEKINKTFKNIDEYIDNDEAYMQLYNTFEHSNENGVITFNFKERLPVNLDSLTRYNIERADVTITIPFKVIEHNADKVDSINNEYTWNIIKEDNKEIYVKFDTNKPLKDKVDYFIYIVIFIVVIVLLIFLSKLNKKRKETNEF